MQIFLLILLIISAYLLGSFSSAVWFGKWFKGIDLREHGSGNAGATNAFRVLGAKIAIPVFIMDVLKAFLAVSLVYFVKTHYTEIEIDIIKIALGTSAVLGHIFPLYTQFKGGKGVASMLGVLLAINPLIACCSLGVFIIVFLISHIVSIGSILAAISFPVFTIFIFSSSTIAMQIFSIIASLLVIFLHKSNIKRLIAGKEKKIKFRKKK
ncbi:MAG: glycerol-3-phosphate 1-O-acyltransferase PlsY [Bacteroidales bacterium]|nr:glycerol-3-phosphate 1-O-acyltransferase PlsY [Bacteroidales bacterium]